MKRHRFYFEGILDGVTVLSTGDLVHQIIRVLKLKAGEEIVLWNGDGNEYVFALEKIGAKDIRGRVVRVEKNDREPDVYGVLYCAILKRENFELVAQKATEVGVSEIVPLVSGRTVKTHINNDRLGKIILEAAEQSGRARIPVLCDAMSFNEALKRAGQDELSYFFDCGEGLQPERADDLQQKKVGVFIGPEGGWTDDERKSAKEAGFIFSSLGPLTLRGETAAIIASYLVCHKFL